MVTLGLIALLLALADIRSMWEILGGTDFRLFLLIVPLATLDRVTQALRWHLLLRAHIRDISPLVVIRVHFIASFLGNFLPFNLGSDGTRVVSFIRSGENPAAMVSSVIVDRAIGFFSLVFVVVLAVMGAVVWGSSRIGQDLIWTIVIALTDGLSYRARNIL